MLSTDRQTRLVTIRVTCIPGDPTDTFSDNNTLLKNFEKKTVARAYRTEVARSKKHRVG